MESEKEKEIKEKLQEEIFIANSFGDKLRKVPTEELEKILTATEKRIKELKKQILQAREISKSDIERLKTQLEQANAGIVNCIGCHLVELNAVEEFAEKLKARLAKFIWRHNIPECIFNDIMTDLLKEYEND